MSKRIVIIENCEECDHSTIGFLSGSHHVCLYQSGDPQDCPDTGTPDWCPLPAVPEKKIVMRNGLGDPEGVIDYWSSGWNTCIDAISRTDE